MFRFLRHFKLVLPEWYGWYFCACKHVTVLALKSYLITHRCLHMRLTVPTDFNKAGKHEPHGERPTLTLSCTVSHPICAGHLPAFVI